MGERDGGMRRENLLSVCLFYLLLFSYPLLSMLWRHAYPVFTPEVAAILLGAALCSVVLTLLLCRVRPALAALGSALLTSLAFMLQFNLQLAATVSCFLISLFLLWKHKTNFYPAALLLLLALITGAFFDSAEDDGRLQKKQDAGPAVAGLPPVVHIILDSFIGVDGLPDYPASGLIRDEVYRLFSDYRFRVFPRAYSRYTYTGDSLYSAFNFRNDGNIEYVLEVLGQRKHVMRSNAEFTALEGLGYRFNIYQTEHIDFCQSNTKNLDRCWNYRHPNVASIQQADEPGVRVRMLLTVLLTQSRLLLGAARGLVHDLGIAVHDPRVFAELQGDLLRDATGRFFLAHVLLPHGPFAFLHDCSVDYNTSPRIRYHTTTLAESPEIYEYRTLRYFEQMECALLSLRRLFEAMKKAGIFDASIIVVHGDHGSLLVKNALHIMNLFALTGDEYRAGFSVLFAVKFPHAPFAIDTRMLPLNVLLEEFTRSISASPAGAKPGQDFLQNLSAGSATLEPYVFLPGSFPLQRVDIDIFEK